jgi:predicted DNA-binding transcriptional regulator AlpA
MKALAKLITKLLRETADKIDTGNCELSDSEAMEIMSVLSHQAMSKEDACIYLNLSRSRFDDLVREGRLPKGRKRRGFKELRWYKDELDIFVKERF